jgi:hypothetical protein
MTKDGWLRWRKPGGMRVGSQAKVMDKNKAKRAGE